MKTFFNQKSALILTMFGMLAILLSSCKKNNDTFEPIVYGDANIRVTNTVLGSNAQDFYQGDTKLSTTAIAYGETSPLIKVKAGNSVLSLKNAGTTTNSVALTVGLETNINYTSLYYTDASSKGQLIGAGDDNTAPAAGKVKIRFANVGVILNNTLNVSVTGGASIVTGLGLGYFTNGYATLDANTSLDFTVLNSGITVPIPGSNFVSGKIYTVWFDAASATTAKFHIIQQN